MIELTLEQIMSEFENQAKDKELVFKGRDSYEVFNKIPDKYFEYFQENYNALISYSSIEEDIDRNKNYVINTDLIKIRGYSS